MTSFLPLFPLKLVVFPGESFNLHIFEPRYKQLIHECDQNGITFGIPAFIDDNIMEFGTEIQLKAIRKRYENGEMDVKTEGVGVFKIREYYNYAPEKLYSGADVERIENHTIGDPDLNKTIFNLVRQLFKVLNIKKPLPKSPDDFTTFTIAHFVGFTLEQEYDFLCLPTEVQRQEGMIEHMERLLPIVHEMENLRLKAQMNGHFKNINPPKIE